MNPNAFQCVGVCAIRYLLKHCSGGIFRTKHFTFTVQQYSWELCSVVQYYWRLVKSNKTGDNDDDVAFYVPCIVYFVLVSNMALACLRYRWWIHWQNVSVSLAYLNEMISFMKFMQFDTSRITSFKWNKGAVTINLSR